MSYNIWLFVQPYLYVPSVIYISLTFLVYMMWLFGTDWYDRFKKLWYNSINYMKVFFWWALVINSFGLLFHENVIYGVAAFNLWCLLLLLVYSIRLTIYLLHSFNKWCLLKRGKL